MVFWVGGGSIFFPGKGREKVVPWDAHCVYELVSQDSLWELFIATDKSGIPIFSTHFNYFPFTRRLNFNLLL